MAASFPDDTMKPAGRPAIDSGGLRASGKKSENALRREAVAIKSFDEFRLQVGVSATTAKFTTLLLSPTVHLTGVCWSTFRNHVFSFPGWSTARRAATREEKIALQVTRKTKAYFISVTYEPSIIAPTPAVTCPIVDSTTASKRSAASFHHEAQAIESFDRFRIGAATLTDKITTLLLSPTVHLIRSSWLAFGKHVRSFPGWYPTRRVATPAEKLASGAMHRKGKVYFVFITFDPAIVTALALAKEGTLPHHEAAKKKALASPATKRPAEDVTPKQSVPSKKVKAEVVLADISNNQQDDTGTRRVAP